MWAVLPPLIHDHTQVNLGLELIKLHHTLVVVQAEDVHCAQDLSLSCEVEKKVEPQMLQRRGLLARVSILVVLPTYSNDWLGEGDAPEDLLVAIVLSEDAIVLASF